MAKSGQSTTVTPRTAPKPKSKMHLKTRPDKEQLRELMVKLKRTSEYSSVMAGCSILEISLTEMLTASFLPMSPCDVDRIFNGISGILSGFDAKIRISYASGILSDIAYHDLLLINAIRNVFAHSPLVMSFGDELVAQDCKSLKLNGIQLTTFKLQEPFDVFMQSVLILYFGIRLGVDYFIKNEIPTIFPFNAVLRESLLKKCR